MLACAFRFDYFALQVVATSWSSQSLLDFIAYIDYIVTVVSTISASAFHATLAPARGARLLPVEVPRHTLGGYEETLRCVDVRGQAQIFQFS